MNIIINFYYCFYSIALFKQYYYYFYKNHILISIMNIYYHQ